MLRHPRWALFLVLAVAVGWLGGLAVPADAAASYRAPASEAADSWAPVGGVLAFAPLAAGAVSRGGALKTLNASPPAAPLAPLPAASPAALAHQALAARYAPAPLCMPLRC